MPGSAGKLHLPPRGGARKCLPLFAPYYPLNSLRFVCVREFVCDCGWFLFPHIQTPVPVSKNVSQKGGKTHFPTRHITRNGTNALSIMLDAEPRLAAGFSFVIVVAIFYLFPMHFPSSPVAHSPGRVCSWEWVFIHCSLLFPGGQSSSSPFTSPFPPPHDPPPSPPRCIKTTHRKATFMLMVLPAGANSAAHGRKTAFHHFPPRQPGYGTCFCSQLCVCVMQPQYKKKTVEPGNNCPPLPPVPVLAAREPVVGGR